MGSFGLGLRFSRGWWVDGFWGVEGEDGRASGERGARDNGEGRGSGACVGVLRKVGEFPRLLW